MTSQQTQIDPAVLTYNLGGKWHQHYGAAPCPVCQTERRVDQNALTINLREDRLLLHCKKSGCNFRDILIAANIIPGQVEIDALAIEDARRTRQKLESKALARARDIWGQSNSLARTHGEAYLRGRGITCVLPDTLRWLPDVFHGPSGGYCSAMVGNVQPTGGIHRTYLSKSGLRLPKYRKMMLGPCGGGAVRLSKTSGPLVVAEGIETALSLLCGLLSGPATVWAALSTSGMKSLRLPEVAGKLIIATDGETAGRKAGNLLANRATMLGWKVSLLLAPDGLDWNDVLMKRCAP